MPWLDTWETSEYDLFESIICISLSPLPHSLRTLIAGAAARLASGVLGLHKKYFTTTCTNKTTRKKLKAKVKHVKTTKRWYLVGIMITWMCAKSKGDKMVIRRKDELWWTEGSSDLMMLAHLQYPLDFVLPSMLTRYTSICLLVSRRSNPPSTWKTQAGSHGLRNRAQWGPEMGRHWCDSSSFRPSMMMHIEVSIRHRYGIIIVM